MTKAVTFVQDGDCLDYTNASEADISYRDVVPLGSRIFIAGETIAVGATGTLCACGVYEIPAENTVAFDFGDTLYWDDVNGCLTKTAGTYRAGYATAAKAQTATTATVKINY